MSPNRKFTGSFQRSYKKHLPKVTMHAVFMSNSQGAPLMFLFESRVPLPPCLRFLCWAQFPLSFNLNKSVSNQRTVHLLTHLQILFLGKKETQRDCAKTPYITKGGYGSRVCKEIYKFPSREKRMNKHQNEVRPPLCCLREDQERRDSSNDGVGRSLPTYKVFRDIYNVHGRSLTKSAFSMNTHGNNFISPHPFPVRYAGPPSPPFDRSAGLLTQLLSTNSSPPSQPLYFFPISKKTGTSFLKDVSLSFLPISVSTAYSPLVLLRPCCRCWPRILSLLSSYSIGPVPGLERLEQGVKDLFSFGIFLFWHHTVSSLCFRLKCCLLERQMCKFFKDIVGVLFSLHMEWWVWPQAVRSGSHFSSSLPRKFYNGPLYRVW